MDHVHHFIVTVVAVVWRSSAVVACQSFSCRQNTRNTPRAWDEIKTTDQCHLPPPASRLNRARAVTEGGEERVLEGELT